jgi:hypothetical protein
MIWHCRIEGKNELSSIESCKQAFGINSPWKVPECVRVGHSVEFAGLVRGSQDQEGQFNVGVSLGVWHRPGDIF